MKGLQSSAVRVLAAWLVISGLLLARTWSDIAARQFVDPDDVLRLVQVRDLLAGQGWFDLHQYRIDGPEGTLMHWSRLVDAPLALVIGVLSPLFGVAGAERVAFVAVPLLTLAAILFAIEKTASRFLDARDTLIACLCVAAPVFLTVQAQPMRIDHHGWQIFTVMLAMTGLVPGRSVRGPVVAGAALAAGLSISLEVLPVTAAFGMVLALRWLMDRTVWAPLVAFLLSLAGSATLIFAGTRGLGDLAQHCDVVSPALLGLFAVSALGAVFAARVNPRSRLALAGILAVAVLAGVGLYVWSAPQCAAGPFGNLDPLVREYWYENVLEGRPAWRVSPMLWVPAVLQGLVALAALAWLGWKRRGEERRWWLEYLAIYCVAFVAALLVWRSMAIAAALSTIPLGWLAGRLMNALAASDRTLRKVSIAAVLLIVLVPAFPVAVAKAIAPGFFVEANEAASPGPAACPMRGVGPTLRYLPAAKIFAPMDLGPTLLDHTGHSVIATSHHRAHSAMRDVVAAFTGAPAQAREIVLRNRADYVLVCSGLPETNLYAERAPKGLAAQLLAGHAPDWLEPVALNGPPGIELWRVRASTAR